MRGYETWDMTDSCLLLLFSQPLLWKQNKPTTQILWKVLQASMIEWSKMIQHIFNCHKSYLQDCFLICHFCDYDLVKWVRTEQTAHKYCFHCRLHRQTTHWTAEVDSCSSWFCFCEVTGQKQIKKTNRKKVENCLRSWMVRCVGVLSLQRKLEASQLELHLNPDVCLRRCAIDVICMRMTGSNWIWRLYLTAPTDPDWNRPSPAWSYLLRWHHSHHQLDVLMCTPAFRKDSDDSIINRNDFIRESFTVYTQTIVSVSTNSEKETNSDIWAGLGGVGCLLQPNWKAGGAG